jgi:Ca2+-binding EF-hand superfamily protein
LTQIMFKMDKNNSKSLDLNEFTVALLDRSLICNRTNMTALFRDIDRKKLGVVTFEELKKALPALGNEKPVDLEMIKSQLDLDKLEKISLQKFCDIMIFK